MHFRIIPSARAPPGRPYHIDCDKPTASFREGLGQARLMAKLRVIQWTTGKVGKLALRGILDDPRLELAGIWVG